MLIRNVNIHDGLVNGSLGVIEKISCSEDCEKHEIEVKFDHDGVTRKVEKLPVKFMTKSGKLFERCQFPLKLWFAATVHKVQGLTLKKAVLDLGPNNFDKYMTYTSLSRCKSLFDISISELDFKYLRCRQETIDYYKALEDLGSEE